LVDLLVEVRVEEEFLAEFHAIFACKPRVSFHTKARDKLKRHAAVGKGQDASNMRLVSAESTFEDVQAGGGIRDGCTGRNGDSGLRDDIEPLSVDQV
jgi:hypothetical protein